MIPGTIHLLVRNRKKIFFDDNIKALTSLNDKGKFDILPEHAHFISLIKEYILIHTLDGKEQKIDIGNGVLKVSENQVQCYIDLINPKIPTNPAPGTVPNTNNTTPSQPVSNAPVSAQSPTVPEAKQGSTPSIPSPEA